MLKQTLQVLKSLFTSEKTDDRFIMQCRQNTFEGIYPGDQTIKSTKGFSILKEIAQSYFKENKYEEFAGFLMEGHYFIQLWAAHLILEFGSASEELQQKAFEQIKAYTENPLAPHVAEQEKYWLENIYKKR
jgi:hypothetical protein